MKKSKTIQAVRPANEFHYIWCPFREQRRAVIVCLERCTDLFLTDTGRHRQQKNCRALKEVIETALQNDGIINVVIDSDDNTREINLLKQYEYLTKKPKDKKKKKRTKKNG